MPVVIRAWNRAKKEKITEVYLNIKQSSNAWKTAASLRGSLKLIYRRSIACPCSKKTRIMTSSSPGRPFFPRNVTRAARVFRHRDLVTSQSRRPAGMRAAGALAESVAEAQAIAIRLARIPERGKAARGATASCSDSPRLKTPPIVAGASTQASAAGLACCCQIKQNNKPAECVTSNYKRSWAGAIRNGCLSKFP